MKMSKLTCGGLVSICGWAEGRGETTGAGSSGIGLAQGDSSVVTSVACSPDDALGTGSSKPSANSLSNLIAAEYRSVRDNIKRIINLKMALEKF